MPKTQKTKTEKIAHPYSRKAMKEERKIRHKHRLEQGRQERSSKLDIQAERLRWFHEHLDDRTTYTKADLVEMLDQLRHRFDEELDQISDVNSVGFRNFRKANKQYAAREAAIKFTQDMEKNEFESVGLEVPDLINKDNLLNFRLWNGEMKYVQNLKMKRISVRDEEKLHKALADSASSVEEVQAAASTTAATSE